MDWFVLRPSKESQCFAVWFRFSIVNVAACYQISEAPQMVRFSLRGECFGWMCFLFLKDAIKALNQQERTPKFSLCSANTFKVPVCVCLIKTFCLNYLITLISHKGEVELYCNCTLTKTDCNDKVICLHVLGNHELNWISNISFDIPYIQLIKYEYTT